MNMHFIYIIPISKFPLQTLTAPQLVMKCPSFSKPDNSLPYSQQPTVLPYPKPHDSNPCLQILTNLKYIVTFSPYLHIGLQSNIIPSGSHQKPLCGSFLSHAPNMSHPSYLPWYEHYNDVYRQIKIVTFLVTEYSPTLSFFLLDSKYSLTTQFSRTLGCILVSVWGTNLGYIKNKSKIILFFFRLVMYIKKRQNVVDQTVANAPQI